MANDANVSSISKSRSIKEMGEFWDTHDAADFDDQTHEVEISFDFGSRRHYIAIDPNLLTRLRALARARGLSTESLANLWLQEHVLIQESSVLS
ncbi:MAG: hypothetical protein H8D78_03955 [Chloroflexi bacterium]|nr:hypothetical protein [Chloroflexota bacterium]